ncbi:MAG: hypothetical protein IH840_11140 [Candidatus Heimdallarchaeota archaeon]|nr:hypothetical protein [Candidatus Heimdallarchaeota archaeon]
MTKNKVNKPATRTRQLAQLKDAGIITLQSDGTYLIDKRGLIMVGANEFYKENKSFNSIDLKREISNIEDGDIQGLQKVLDKLQPIDRETAYHGIINKSRELIEIQDDLSDLESY